MLKVAIGHSEDPDTIEATKSIIKQCQQSLEKQPNAALLFASIGYDYSYVLKEIKKLYPNISIAGCSSRGEMSNKLGYCPNSVLLIMFEMSENAVYPIFINNLSEDVSGSIKTAITTATKSLEKKPSFILTFPDVLKSDIGAILEGIQNILGKNFPITGGGAAENYKFDVTYQIGSDEVATHGLSALLFTKPIVCSSSEKHGMIPISPKHLITKSKDNMIFEIDNKPALDVYYHYAGRELALEYGGSFAIYDDPTTEQFTIKYPFYADKENKSLMFGSKIKDHSQIRIMKANKNNLLNAVKECIDEAIKFFPGKNIGCALVFSCSIRREVLGTEVDQELAIIKQALPENTPVAGLYVYGEIGPFEHNQPVNFYSETMVIALIGE